MKLQAEAAAATVELPTKDEVKKQATVTPPKPSVVQPTKPSEITKEEEITKILEEKKKQYEAEKIKVPVAPIAPADEKVVAPQETAKKFEENVEKLLQ